MQSLSSGTSKPTMFDRSFIGRAPIRYASLPLQLDIDSGSLLSNDRNKMILADIRAALSSADSSRSDIDTIFRHASVCDYMHILRVIINGLPKLAPAFTREHLERLEVNEPPATSQVMLSKSGSESPTTEGASCRLKLPPSLKAFYPAALSKYSPIFLQALAGDKFAEKVTVLHGKPDHPGSNNFDPSKNGLNLSPSKGLPSSYAIPTMVHELSHARDYIALGHAQIKRDQYQSVRRTGLADGQKNKAEDLFTTELKAWLLEAMQIYLIIKANGTVNRFQYLLLEGFHAGYQDIACSEFNFVRSRIEEYLKQLGAPKPTFEQLFSDGDTPLKEALCNGILELRKFILEVHSGREPDPHSHIKKLDDIFHINFYATEEQGSKKKSDLATLRSITDAG